MYIYIYTHTDTCIHTYIYIYISVADICGIIAPRRQHWRPRRPEFYLSIDRSIFYINTIYVSLISAFFCVPG